MAQENSPSYWEPRGSALYQAENESYASLLCSHVHGMTRRLRRLPPEHWDWTPDPAAPTARILAKHMYQWLVCDRQHLQEPDALKHLSVPEMPDDPEAFCDLLDEENRRWFELLLSLTPQQLDEPRFQFNASPWNVRTCICHTIQNTIYKHGEFATLFFALGHDGTAPYAAPFPNDIYKRLHEGTLE